MFTLTFRCLEVGHWSCFIFKNCSKFCTQTFERIIFIVRLLHHFYVLFHLKNQFSLPICARTFEHTRLCHVIGLCPGCHWAFTLTLNQCEFAQCPWDWRVSQSPRWSWIPRTRASWRAPICSEPPGRPWWSLSETWNCNTNKQHTWTVCQIEIKLSANLV